MGVTAQYTPIESGANSYIFHETMGQFLVSLVKGGSGGGDGSFMTPDIHTLYLYQYSVYLYYILPISLPHIPPEMTTKRALLIGINYTDVPGDTLNGCIDDIENIGEVLTTQYGYQSTDVVMLRDVSEDPALQPTRENMLQALRDIVAVSGSCSEIWIHYSGHGSLVNNGTMGVIVPVDYATEGFITDNDLMNILQHVQCPAMIMFDSCNSGAVCDLEWSYEFLYGNNFVRTQLDFPSLSNKNIIMISACKSTQQSADVYDNVTMEYEGVFTDAVLNVLKDNNYTVTLGKLMQGVCTWLVQNGIETQKPMLSSTSDTPRWSVAPYVVPPSTTSVIQSNFQSVMGGV